MKVKPIICAVLKKMQQVKLGLKISPIIERDFRWQDPLRQLCCKKVKYDINETMRFLDVGHDKPTFRPLLWIMDA